MSLASHYPFFIFVAPISARVPHCCSHACFSLSLSLRSFQRWPEAVLADVGVCGHHDRRLHEEADERRPRSHGLGGQRSLRVQSSGGAVPGECGVSTGRAILCGRLCCVTSRRVVIASNILRVQRVCLTRARSSRGEKCYSCGYPLKAKELTLTISGR